MVVDKKDIPRLDNVLQAVTPARRRQLRTSLHRHHRLFLWDEEGHSTAPCGLAYDLTLHALCQRAARLPATAKTGNEALSADLDLRGAAFRGLPHHDEPRCLGLCAHSAARQGRGARVARVVHLDVRAPIVTNRHLPRVVERGVGGGEAFWDGTARLWAPGGDDLVPSDHWSRASIGALRTGGRRIRQPCIECPRATVQPDVPCGGRSDGTRFGGAARAASSAIAETPPRKIASVARLAWGGVMSRKL